MQTLELLYVGGGLLLTLISIPLIQRRVRPNPFYGFRIPRTLNDPRVWYDANAYSGKRLFVVGIVIAIAALVFAQVPNLTVDSYALACSAVIFVGLGIAIWQSWRYAVRSQ